MSKTKRQEALIDIVAHNIVDTQEELCSILTNRGFNVTQATVCRDIKELGLVKSSENGRTRYVYIENESGGKMSQRLQSLFKDSVIAVKRAGHIVVVKTLAGSANTAATFIDQLGLDSIVGCVAGDDTLFLAVDHSDNVALVISELQKYMG